MRVLVVKLSSLGDLAHALPAVAALKQRTGAEVDWAVQSEYAPLLDCAADVRRTIAFPRRKFWRHAYSFCRELRRETYDLILDLQGLFKSALVSRLARGKLRLGPASAREGAHVFYHQRPPRQPGPRKHAVEEALEIIALAAPGSDPPPMPRLHLPQAKSSDEPGPHVALAPFSRWTTKNWPLEKFAELARRLIAEMGCHFDILGGPENADAGEQLARQIGRNVRNTCGRTDLPGLCARLKAMDLVIGVDSGPLHWADIMGAPLVAIMGATDPGRTGPYFQREQVVVKEGLACRPCHARHCARGDLACLHTLEAHDVLPAALRRL